MAEYTVDAEPYITDIGNNKFMGKEYINMKKITATLLSILVLLSIAGCNTQTSSPENTSVIEVIPSASSEEILPTPYATTDPIPSDSEYSPIETPSAVDENGDPYYAVVDTELTLSQPLGGMGFHGIIVTSSDDIWEGVADASKLNLTTLPVIRRQHYSFFDEKIERPVQSIFTTKQKNNIEQNLITAGSFLGQTITPQRISTSNVGEYSLEYNSNGMNLSCSAEALSTTIYGDFNIRITDAISGEDLMKMFADNDVLNGFIEYAGFTNPVCKRYSSYAYDKTGVAFYYIYNEEDDDRQTLMNQSLSHIELYFAYDNILVITFRDIEYNEKTIKEYEVIPYEDALDALIAGDYYTDVPYEFKEENIKYADIAYLTMFNERYYIPFYRFYVNTEETAPAEGLEAWGIYYVSALKDLDISIDEDVSIG